MGPLFVNRAKCVCTQPWAFGDPDTPIWRDFFWGEGLKVEDLSFFHFSTPKLSVCALLLQSRNMSSGCLELGRTGREAGERVRGDDSWVESFFHGRPKVLN